MINVDHAGFYFFFKLPKGLNICAKNRSRQAVFRGVGPFDGVVDIRIKFQPENRAEDFFEIDL